MKTRYIKVIGDDGYWSIWELNKTKTKERLIATSLKHNTSIDKLRKVWTKYTKPNSGETETEITEEEAFTELL